MFYFAKALQAGAMGVVALALFVGFHENSMTKELTMLGIGSVVFLVARAIEQNSGRA
ncbi:MAG: hypothetical protein HYR96_06255 [Deltaproteobacteria bacterium]|nr:hypothetical protein [Deltaproteobacteria bacterium]MBI3296187.1 hypothetical protein [Deltaproteobacteria bacterium]